MAWGILTFFFLIPWKFYRKLEGKKKNQRECLSGFPFYVKLPSPTWRPFSLPPSPPHPHTHYKVKALRANLLPWAPDHKLAFVFFCRCQWLKWPQLDIFWSVTTQPSCLWAKQGKFLCGVPHPPPPLHYPPLLLFTTLQTPTIAHFDQGGNLSWFWIYAYWGKMLSEGIFMLKRGSCKT